MSHILARYKDFCRSDADAIRWACALEAMSPKLGNVHPTANFPDLKMHHFLIAGDALADSCEQHDSIGEIVLAAVQNCRESCQTNVNLGIALLIAPLFLASRRRITVAEILKKLSPSDTMRVYEAINFANPGGMGKVDEMDVRESPPFNLLAAMRLAEKRDRIARQYTHAFQDVFDFIAPTLARSIEFEIDVLLGIRLAQIQIIAEYGDSLIERKCGHQLSNEAKTRARRLLDIKDDTKRKAGEEDFDIWLRADNNRRNPGTTADLIAAGMFLLLQENHSF